VVNARTLAADGLIPVDAEIQNYKWRNYLDDVPKNYEQEKDLEAIESLAFPHAKSILLHV